MVGFREVSQETWNELVWGIGKLSKMSRIWVGVEEQRIRCSRMRRHFESGSNDEDENGSFGRQEDHLYRTSGLEKSLE